MGVHSYWQIHSQAFMSAHSNIWMCYKPFIKLHLALIEAKQTGQDTIVCLSCLNIPSSLYLFAWFPVIVVRSLLYLCVWGVYEFTTHTVSSCTEISFFSFFFFLLVVLFHTNFLPLPFGRGFLRVILWHFKLLSFLTRHVSQCGNRSVKQSCSCLCLLRNTDSEPCS